MYTSSSQVGIGGIIVYYRQQDHPPIDCSTPERRSRVLIVHDGRVCSFLGHCISPYHIIIIIPLTHSHHTRRPRRARTHKHASASHTPLLLLLSLLRHRPIHRRHIHIHREKLVQTRIQRRRSCTLDVAVPGALSTIVSIQHKQRWRGCEEFLLLTQSISAAPIPSMPANPPP